MPVALNLLDDPTTTIRTAQQVGALALKVFVYKTVTREMLCNIA